MLRFGGRGAASATSVCDTRRDGLRAPQWAVIKEDASGETAVGKDDGNGDSPHFRTARLGNDARTASMASFTRPPLTGRGGRGEGSLSERRSQPIAFRISGISVSIVQPDERSSPWASLAPPTPHPRAALRFPLPKGEGS